MSTLFLPPSQSTSPEIMQALATHFYSTTPSPLVILPTKQSVLSLSEELLNLPKAFSTFRPRLVSLSELETLPEISLVRMETPPTETDPSLWLALPQDNRLMLLTKQILSWWEQQNFFEPNTETLSDDSPKSSQTALAQAFLLARELATLMDKVEEENLSWEALSDMADHRLAQHWQNVLQLLAIIQTHWPQILFEEKRVSPITHLGKSLQLLCEKWKQAPPSFPVVFVLTNGMPPFWDSFIQTIDALPHGIVLLANFSEDPAVFTQKDYQQSVLADPTHRLHSLLNQLQRIGWETRPLRPWYPIHSLEKEKEERRKLLEKAFQPIGLTHVQTSPPSPLSPNTPTSLLAPHVNHFEAEHNEEEAMLITLIIRHVLQKPGQNIALITPQRALKTRVETHLKNLSLIVRDSAGFPLLKTLPGNFFSLLLDTIAHDFSWLNLNSLCQHHFFGDPSIHPTLLEGWSLLETRYIRPAIQTKQFLWFHLYTRTPFDFSTETPSEKQAIETTLNFLRKSLSPLMHCQKKHLSIEAWSTLFLETLQNLHPTTALWHGEAGNQLASFFQHLLHNATPFNSLSLSHYIAFIHARALDFPVRFSFGTDPRVGIYGLMEAQLQKFHTVIIAGLNEGTFPPAQHNLAWLSPSMRNHIGLPVPQTTTGLATNDFFSIVMQAEDVFLTRSLKENGLPTEPSRWLLQLQLAAQNQPHQHINNKEQPNFPALLKRITQYPATPTPTRPHPMPPTHVRPTSFSPSSIQRLFQDPYVYYARDILALKPQPPLSPPPSPLIFGNLLHNALETFYLQHPQSPLTTTCQIFQREIMTLINPILHTLPLTNLVRTSWQYRYEKALQALFEQEQKIITLFAQDGWTLKKHFMEQKIETFLSSLSPPLHIGARFDRIDLYEKNTQHGKQKGIVVVDYKTGRSQKKPSDFLSPKEPQGIICAYLAHQNAFKNTPYDAQFLAFFYLYPEKEDTQAQVNLLEEDLPPYVQDFQINGISSLIHSRLKPYVAYRDPTTPLKDKKNLFKDTYVQLNRWYEWFRPHTKNN